MKLDIKMLLVTAGAGLIMGLVEGFLLYPALINACPRPVAIGLLLMLFALVICGVVFLCSRIWDQSDDEFLFLTDKGPIALGLAVLMLVTFGMGTLLEWIYDSEREIVSGTVATSYIFVLDESGSMGSNDPKKLRYNAVNTTMQSMPADFPFAVYLFGTDCAQYRPLAPLSAGTMTEPWDTSDVGGGTEIGTALQKVIADIKAGRLNGGTAPRVVLMTDGNDYSFSADDPVVQEYRNAGVSISTVALGSADVRLLRQLAQRTGGGFARVSTAQQLAIGLSTAAAASRDLMSVRSFMDNDGLYCFLRILFLTLMGVLSAFAKAMAFSKGESTVLILAVGAGGALLGALFVEFLVGFGSLPVAAGFIVYLTLVAVTPYLEKERYIPKPGTQNIYTHRDVTF